MNKKIYICTTNSCQLHCKGCYMNSIYGSSQSVDIQFVRQVLNDNIKNEIECVFHGGEPFFTRDDDTIQSYINLVKDYPNIKWSATTNLVYNITSKLFELFSLFNNKFLKTSWDVDNYRFQNNEQKQIWTNNLQLLLNKGFDVEVIITVNTQTIQKDPNEILEYFKQLGITWINFERITENGRALENHVKPTNREIDNWLYKAFTYNKNNTKLHIPLFEELENIVKGGKPVGCRLRTCMQNVMTINSNNTVGTCPNIANEIIGKQDQYTPVYFHDKHQSLIDKEKQINTKCFICPYFKICHAECCQLKWDDTGCPGLIQILKEIINEKTDNN